MFGRLHAELNIIFYAVGAASTIVRSHRLSERGRSHCEPPIARDAQRGSRNKMLRHSRAACPRFYRERESSGGSGRRILFLSRNRATKQSLFQTKIASRSLS